MHDKTGIVFDSKVRDNFIRLEPQESFQGYYDKYGDDIADWYEQGKLIILDSPPKDLKRDLYSQVVFPYQNRSLKKLKDRDIKSANIKRFKAFMGPDEKLCKEFVKQANIDQSILTDGVKKIFSRYEFNEVTFAWRFSVTHTEDIHLDSYGVEETSHVVRLFWNTDTYPRIWMVGNHIEDICKEKNIPYNFDHPRELNRFINHNYLGDTKGRFQTTEPHHIMIVPSGSIFLVHSQKIPHGPIFGRGLCSMSCFVNPDSMVDPSSVFARLGEKLNHREVLCVTK